MKLSVVSPVYRAENILEVLVDRIKKSVPKEFNQLEIVLVEDHGPDLSWNVIEVLATKHKEIKGVKLSKNFGQHYAITAGLDFCSGDWIVVMDCDLQDQPEEISKLFAKAKEGYDVVLARRFERKDHFIKTTFSKLFYSSLSYLTGSDQDSTVANFGIYSKKVIEAIVSMRESIRYFPTMVKWVGFRTARIDVEHASRLEGQTSYNFKKLLNLALDIILAYSDKPLRLTIKFGLLLSLSSFVFSIYTLISWTLGKIVVLGYASLLISIWFLSGCILMTIGIVGLYVGKTFQGVKNRPIYIVEKRTWE
jgi:polyisoprenyl-phosphate glycosyltransferase